ncbi:hypothetical protein PC111_g22136 [Phytophthora cactorum]|nr:hypothetical protein PC111_g22136 [Phytophthora cactorum]
MPFYNIGHATFLEALKLLHPGVEVPNAEQLSTVFLDRAFNRSIKIVTVTLGGKVVTLVTYCWTDINGKAVVNYCAVCGIYTFLESAYTGTQSHDAAFLTADVERVIAKYDFLEVGAVVTDNTSTNQATWKALQEKFPNSRLHIVKKIKWMDDRQSGCKILVSFFRKHHKMWADLSACLKEKGLRVLAKPGAQDGGLCWPASRRFSPPRAKTKKQKKTRRVVYDLATSTSFVSRLEKAVSLLKPINSKSFEKNTTPVSGVYQVFTELPAELNVVNLTAAEHKTVKTLIKSRFDFIYGDAHGLAYLLDPRYGGINMDNCVRGAVELAAYHCHVRELKASQPHHWKFLCEQKIPVFDFWCGMNKFPLLQEVALQVFRCATSSSASERNFLAHAFIHSKLRNRLASDRVEKLVHIYFNAKNICDKDIERYSHLEYLLREADEEEDADERNGGNESEDFVYY